MYFVGIFRQKKYEIIWLSSVSYLFLGQSTKWFDKTRQTYIQKTWTTALSHMGYFYHTFFYTFSDLGSPSPNSLSYTDMSSVSI